MYILRYISSDIRFSALYAYIRKLKGENIQISKYDFNKLNNWNTNIKYDVMDIYGLKYLEKYLNNLSSEIENVKYCIYKLPRSGFFSTILTAVNIVYYCKVKKITLMLDWSEWIYDFDPSIFFEVQPDLRGVKDVRNFHDQDILFVSSRVFLDAIIDKEDLLQDFKNYRKLVINNVYSWCKENIDITAINNSIDLNLNNFIVCFIRRGDKLKRESYPIDIDSYKIQLKSYENLLIIGDDNKFNKKLSSLIPCREYCDPAYIINGGDLSHNNYSAVKSILTNFYILSSSKNIIGDPYCNLVAAAMIKKNIIYSYDRVLHPWRLRNYF